MKNQTVTNKTMELWKEECRFNDSEKPSPQYQWHQAMSIYKGLDGQWRIAYLEGRDLEPDEITRETPKGVYKSYQEALRAAIDNTYGYRGIASYLGADYLRIKALLKKCRGE